MTTLWQRLALLTAVFVLGPARPAPAQELNNPGFEVPGPTLVSTSDAPSGKAQISGVVADDWQDNTNWADVKIAYSLDPDHPHGGKFSQRVAIGRGFAQFTQPVTFRAGRYRATLWLRAQPAQWVSVFLRLSGSPYTTYAVQAAKVGPRWTPVTVEGVTPAVDGGLYINTSAPGTLWLDDASLRSLGNAPPSAQALAPPRGVIPRAFFGLNVNHMHDPPGFDWPALDFGAYRTWTPA